MTVRVLRTVALVCALAGVAGGAVPSAQHGGAAPAATAGSPSPAGRKIDIEAGRHFWAYQPIRQPAVPSVKDAAWPRGEIDRFVLARLEAHQLHPVEDADAGALVRRVYFDLTGLPPTPEQLDAFANEKGPDGAPLSLDVRYEHLVDRLLASQQFGERWGRHWLDVARFAESLTLRGFVLTDTWRYRDYVIDSFNQDRPFDRFVQEQVAGDLLPAKSLEERRRLVVASAFLAMGNYNLEEQDKTQLEMDVIDEQIDTLGKALLGQTISCARCHDHKFDPIPTRDYYALAGILQSTQTLEYPGNVSKWLQVPLPVEPQRERVLQEQRAALAKLQEKINSAKAALAKADVGKPGKGATPLSKLAGIVVDDPRAKRVGIWKESKSVASYVGDGYLTDNGDRKEEKTLTFMPEITESGRYEVRFAYTPGANRATNVSVTVFSADGEKTVVVNEKEPPPVDGHFVSLGQYTFEKNGQGFVLVSNQDANGHVVADAAQFVPADAASVAVGNASATAGKSHAPATRPAKVARGGAKPSDASIKAMEAELKRMTAEAAAKQEAVAAVREAKQIGDGHIHLRGSAHHLGDTVPRGFLEVVPVSGIPPIPAGESGRLELADWLTSPQNPLPARVMANRVWHWLFGAGIVRTTDNFGTTGEPPSHPELLDYLASRFVAEHWSVKRLIREIVLSRTYRLSTRSDAAALAADPENRLLWRMNHRRLDAECLRDAMLSVSAQLDLRSPGRTYKPGLTTDFGFKNDDAHLRSVYLPVFRNALPEMFELFDFADPSVSTGRRNVSTVAPQALFLMNHPFVLDQSRRAAERLLADPGCRDDAARIDRAYRLTLGRLPTAGERRIAETCLQSSGGADRTDAYARLFHALFASMDFRYVD